MKENKIESILDSITDEKERKLRKAFLDSDLFNYEEMTNEYIMSLDPLIKKYASSYTRRSKRNSVLSFEDYVNEAYLRIYNVFPKFKFATSSVKLSTFIVWHIRDAMQSLKVKVEPSTVCTTSGVKLYAKIQKLRAENPQITSKDISTILKISETRLMAIEDSAKQNVSMAECVSDDEKITLGDSLSSKCFSPEEEFLLNESKKSLFKLLSTVLDEREEKIIINHFGLNDNNCMTHADAAKINNCSRENIRLIKEKALTKIRSSSSKNSIIENLNLIISIKNKRA